jgi:hypothetical protein
LANVPNTIIKIPIIIKKYAIISLIV